MSLVLICRESTARSGSRNLEQRFAGRENLDRAGELLNDSEGSAERPDRKMLVKTASKNDGPGPLALLVFTCMLKSQSFSLSTTARNT